MNNWYKKSQFDSGTYNTTGTRTFNVLASFSVTVPASENIETDRSNAFTQALKMMSDVPEDVNIIADSVKTKDEIDQGI